MWSSVALNTRVLPSPRPQSVAPHPRGKAEKAAACQPNEWNESVLIEELLSDNPVAWREFNTRREGHGRRGREGGPKVSGESPEGAETSGGERVAVSPNRRARDDESMVGSKP
jgi:hypothetical protein